MEHQGYCLPDHAYVDRQRALRRPIYDEFFRALGSTDELALTARWRAQPLAIIAANRVSGTFEDEACRSALKLAQLSAPLLVAVATSATGPGLKTLSARERQVAACVRAGFTNREIGCLLRVSPLTARNHVAAILRKLEVSNRAELAAVAAKGGI